MTLDTLKAVSTAMYLQKAVDAPRSLKSLVTMMKEVMRGEAGGERTARCEIVRLTRDRVISVGDTIG
jgi:hypothetical protein